MTHVERTATGLRIHGAHPTGLFGCARVAKARDGRLVLAVVGHTMSLFDARTGEPVGASNYPWLMPANDLILARLPDERLVLVTAHDYGITRFDVETGVEHEPTRDEEPGTIWAVTPVRLPDGRTVIAGAGHDGLVYRWDDQTGAAIGDPLQGHSIIVKSITTAHGPDGTPMIVSGCERGEIRRWDATTGMPVGGPLPGGLGEASGLGVLDLPDGRQMLAGADFDGGLHRWDPATGLPLGSPIPTPERARLVENYLDAAGVPVCWLYFSHNNGDEWIEQRRLDTGAVITRESPVSARAFFQDGGRTMLVRTYPDGSLTIEPPPPAPE